MKNKFRVRNTFLNEWFDGVAMLGSDGEVYYLNEDTGLFEPTSDLEINMSTGEKDKNGVEIYEGDIVKMHYFYEGHDPVTFGRYEAERNVIGVVKMDAMGTYTETNEEYGIYRWVSFLQELQEELEVVGDVYENKELLND